VFYRAGKRKINNQRFWNTYTHWNQDCWSAIYSNHSINQRNWKNNLTLRQSILKISLKNSHAASSRISC